VSSTQMYWYRALLNNTWKREDFSIYAYLELNWFALFVYLSLFLIICKLFAYFAVICFSSIESS
jgi:hypothetical protein